ncbi:MAG: hypothetical protein GX589_06650 [Deltaproteobacteria bacterium]|nr:hypothetical protein [Deltaproteobacteria bacterium]
MPKLTEEEQDEVLRATRKKLQGRWPIANACALMARGWLISAAKVILRIAVVLYTLYYALFFWQLSTDDGPFTGSPRSDCPRRAADQYFVLRDDQQLLVFDPEPGEVAPTVALQKASGEVEWCIYAVGMENTAVYKLRFVGTRWHPIPFMPPYVRGWVNWSYGSERMTWSIGHGGKLNWYKYSW